MSALVRKANQAVARRYLSFGVRLALACARHCEQSQKPHRGRVSVALQESFRVCAAQEEDGARGVLIAISAPALAALAGIVQQQSTELAPLVATCTLCGLSGVGVMVYSLDQSLRQRLVATYNAHSHDGFLEHLYKVQQSVPRPVARDLPTRLRETFRR